MAVRTGRVQGVGDCQGRVDRCVGVHVDRAQRRPVLCHRQPTAQAARARPRPICRPDCGHRGRGHLGGGHRVRRAGRPVHVPPSVPPEQRHGLRGVLPIPRVPGTRLPQDRRYRQVPRLLCRTAGRHRVLLRAHCHAPCAYYQQHARRATSKSDSEFLLALMGEAHTCIGTWLLNPIDIGMCSICDERVRRG